MRWRTFTAEVEQGHKGCALILPFDPAAAWGARARHFVAGTIAGVPYEAELGRRWGRDFTCVDDDVLDALKLEPGDRVKVTMRERTAGLLDGAKAPRLPGVRLVAPPARAARPAAAKRTAPKRRPRSR
jgi:hypothetical protein